MASQSYIVCTFLGVDSKTSKCNVGAMRSVAISNREMHILEEGLENKAGGVWRRDVPREGNSCPEGM